MLSSALYSFSRRLFRASSKIVPSLFSTLQETSHMIPVSKSDEVHIKQMIREDVDASQAPTVLCLHGAVSNGRLFYPSSQTGFLFLNQFNS